MEIGDLIKSKYRDKKYKVTEITEETITVVEVEKSNPKHGFITIEINRENFDEHWEVTNGETD